jgi:hypothetical protein
VKVDLVEEVVVEDESGALDASVVVFLEGFSEEELVLVVAVE